MNQTMTERRLMRETRTYRGTGGISAENRCHGFRPAFLDQETGTVYASLFGDGRPAPFHLLDGLPDEVVVARDALGRVAVVKSSVLAGFVRAGRFHSREEAARHVAETEPAFMPAS